MQRSCQRFEVVIFSKAWCGEVRLFSRVFLLVVLHDMVEPGKRKFGSVRRKKRKGFCGHNGANKRPKLTKEADQDGGWKVKSKPEARVTSVKPKICR